MKKYIALKKMYFDKSYAVGEEIPKDVIAPNMVSKLVRCGVIAAVEGQNNSQNEPDFVKENVTKKEEMKPKENTDQNGTNKEEKDSLENGGQNNGSEENDVVKDKQQNNMEKKTENAILQSFTEKELLQKKKEELEQITKQLEIETKESMTKAELTTLILEKGKG